MRPSLTLNLGLRWEFAQPLVDKYDRLTSFVPELGKIIVAGKQGVPDFDQAIADAGLAAHIGLAKDHGLPRPLTYTEAEYRAAVWLRLAPVRREPDGAARRLRYLLRGFRLEHAPQGPRQRLPVHHLPDLPAQRQQPQLPDHVEPFPRRHGGRVGRDQFQRLRNCARRRSTCKAGI